MGTWIHGRSHSLFNGLRRIKVKYRLLLTFFLITLIPLLTLTVITYNISINTNFKTLQKYSSSTMAQASNAISNGLTALEDVAVRISYTDNVQKLLLTNPSESLEIKALLEDGIRSQLEYEFHLTTAVESVQLYSTSSEELYTVYGESVDGSRNLHTTLDAVLGKIKKEGGRTVYSSFLFSAGKKGDDYAIGHIQLSRPIYSEENKSVIGYLFLTFQENHLSSIYRQVDAISDSKTFIINSDNRIISNIGTKLTIGDQLSSSELLPNLENNGYSKQPTFDFWFHGKEYFAAYSPIINTDMFVVSLIPKDFIYESNQNILYSFGVIAFLAFALAFLASLLVSQSIISPINLLMIKIQGLKKSTHQTLVQDSAMDELAVLNNTFNEMVVALDEAGRQKNQALEEKHKMHLDVLQAQINPHFLVNTLNSLKWLAVYQNASNIEELSGALINIIRQTFGKDNELTTIADEFKTLEDYSTIQAYHYFNDITITTQIDPSVRDCKIPRFLIQPLVENCYIHGFKESQGKCMILVNAVEYKENLVQITVTDNGMGLSEEKFLQLLEGRSDSKAKGITSFGIHNVNERIKLYYGKEYSLSFISEPYIYTTFEMIIPKD